MVEPLPISAKARRSRQTKARIPRKDLAIVVPLPVAAHLECRSSASRGVRRDTRFSRDKNSANLPACIGPLHVNVAGTTVINTRRISCTDRN